MKNIAFYSFAATAIAGLVPSGAVASGNCAHKKDDAKEPKNVLMIAIDDLKPLLGCYGDPLAKTPNIDALAKDGVLFTNAYCQQAVSAATRASLLTGYCPDRTGVWDLKTQIRAKNPDVVTLPQYFIQNGYHVAGIGKIFDPRSVDKKSDVQSWSEPYLGYEDYLDSNYGKPVLSQYQDPETRRLYEKYAAEAKEKGIGGKNKIDSYVQEYIKPSTECLDIPDNAYTDGAVASGAVDFIEKYDSSKPLFLAVGFKKPHLPFCAPEKYWNLYNREEMPLARYTKRAENSPAFAYHNSSELKKYTDIPPVYSYSDIDNTVLTAEKARELIHGYYACVSYTDAQIGKVLAALEKKGMKENTIIVLWGDHGWHLGDHGLWNKHTNFENAARVPFIIIDPSARAGKIDAPVEFLSIYPTLCALAGIEIPDGLDGENLSKVVRNVKKAKVERKYAASQFPRGPRMGYSLRTERYRYTVWVDWKDRNLNVDKVIAEELYDYEADPLETKNLAGEKEYADALKLMKSYWEEYKKERINK